MAAINPSPPHQRGRMQKMDRPGCHVICVEVNASDLSHFVTKEKEIVSAPW